MRKILGIFLLSLALLGCTTAQESPPKMDPSPTVKASETPKATGETKLVAYRVLTSGINAVYTVKYREVIYRAGHLSKEDSDGELLKMLPGATVEIEVAPGVKTDPISNAIQCKIFIISPVTSEQQAHPELIKPLAETKGDGTETISCSWTNE